MPECLIINRLRIGHILTIYYCRFIRLYLHEYLHERYKKLVVLKTLNFIINIYRRKKRSLMYIIYTERNRIQKNENFFTLFIIAHTGDILIIYFKLYLFFFFKKNFIFIL